MEKQMTVEEFVQTFPILRQRKLADAVGVHFNAVNRWINGHFTPTPYSAKKMTSVIHKLANQILSIEIEDMNILSKPQYPEKEQLTIEEFFERFPILKQKNMCELMGIDYRRINSYARGETCPKEYTVQKFNSELQKIATQLQNTTIIRG